jgi:hypothetical protein
MHVLQESIRIEKLKATLKSEMEDLEKWKKELAEYHAEEASKILKQIGYNDTVVERVKSINLKKNLKTDSDVQTIEDALCLVTLQYQIEGFSLKHDDENIKLQKTPKLSLFLSTIKLFPNSLTLKLPLLPYHSF